MFVTREHNEVSILMKFDTYLFSLATVRVEGVKLRLKLRIDFGKHLGNYWIN